jgi:hypothetical protein
MRRRACHINLNRGRRLDAQGLQDMSRICVVGDRRGNLVQAGIFLELISRALALLTVAVTLTKAIKSQSTYCCFSFEDAWYAQRLPSRAGTSSSPP